ncbi:MAG: hypothetical protein ACR2HR_12375 [Euzebya sp.]
MTATGRLDAFALREEVIGTYRDYVKGCIKISDPLVAAEVDEALASGNLWPEPWVQINPTYKLEADTDELIDRGLFAEAPGQGAHWDMSAFHATTPRGGRQPAPAVGTLEEILVGPCDR